MTRYFMRDTPLQAMEQLMMSQPGQKPRGGGIYGQQRLQETLGLDDEAICELDGYMDFEKYGTDCMENDSVIETEFGRLRRLEPPFPEQTQRQQMFQ